MIYRFKISLNNYNDVFRVIDFEGFGSLYNFYFETAFSFGFLCGEASFTKNDYNGKIIKEIDNYWHNLSDDIENNGINRFKNIKIQSFFEDNLCDVYLIFQNFKSIEFKIELQGKFAPENGKEYPYDLTRNSNEFPKRMPQELLSDGDPDLDPFYNR